MTSRSRRAIRASFIWNLPPSEIRGRRESRMRAAPAVSCANVHKNTHTSIQVQRRTSGLPCAVAYDLSRDLPGEPSSVAINARGKNSFRELDASFRAPEPHAFAVRIAALVSRKLRVHR